ncbi:hypothetical protein [Prochlorococcus sp. MIT 1300]|uniref:hypothetical protein n=1 Tax=Prochlorococcus sp. MIT 1300 TaxID=3096218 RepID=UPI002A763766|nr:hypothetical protein [Prochlorococcus sp. MIT 1300]
MSLLRPPSNERPGEQSAQTPSGKKVPMAMSMMVDSMVRMIQKASNNHSDINHETTGE